MTGDDRLHRSYRRLLRVAYPGWYRRERGLEMLTTLLDAAAPGQIRPTRQDVADIVLGGVRCRLRIPRVLALRTVAAFTTVASATLTAGVVGLVALGTVDPLPTEAEAVAIAEVAMLVPPHNVPGPVVDCYYMCPVDSFVAGDQVVSFDEPFDRLIGMKNLSEHMPTGLVPLEDHVTIRYRIPGADTTAVTEAARSRLIDHGWEVGEADGVGGYKAFWATDGELSLCLSSHYDDSTYLIINRRMPLGIGALILVGSLAGLLAGWLAAGWVTQRLQRHRTVVRVAVGIAATPVLTAALLTQGTMFLFGAYSLLGGDISARTLLNPAVALWMLDELANMSVLMWIIGVGTAVILGLAALPLRRSSTPDTVAPGA